MDKQLHLDGVDDLTQDQKDDEIDRNNQSLYLIQIDDDDDDNGVSEQEHGETEGQKAMDTQDIRPQQEGESQEGNLPVMRRSTPALFDFVRVVRTEIQKFRDLCGKVVNNHVVQLFIVVLISCNAILMGIATFDFVADNPDIDSAFEKTDLAFLIVFTIEFSLQLIYHGIKLFLDGWLVFDCIVIIASWSLSSVQIIRAFRIFRALRLVTRVKVMKNLVLAVLSVLPRIAAICTLLCLIFYIFAVMMTQMFGDLYQEGKTEEDYFSRLDATFFTLFQMMTLDDWSNIARQVIGTYSWAWVPIVFFVTISGFVVVNLIIAVICDAVSSLHDDIKAKMHGSFNEDDDSGHHSNIDLGQQLEILEEQVDTLHRIQEKMMSRLAHLTQKLKDRPSQTDCQNVDRS